MRVSIVGALTLAIAAPAASAETVDVYAAGSLRAVVAALAGRAAVMGIEIRPVFGGAGDLRARIEKGAKPDLLLSADLTSPRALVAQGRADGAAVAFARNRMCVIAPISLRLTPATLVDRLLAPGMRVKTSRPVADPSGDYAMAMFARIDARRPGAGARLRANADRQMAVVAPEGAAGQNPIAALFTARLVDAVVTYCSAGADLVRSAPGLASVEVPTAFDPKPVFGLVTLSRNPAAARLALLLLSDVGQAAVAASGLLPLASSAP